VLPRQLCMSVLYLCHKWTLVATGNLFNRDHTTVIHSIQTVKNLIETDSNYCEEVKYLFPEMLLALKNRKDYPLRNVRL
jgi:chromosomal replication initiation ATPase DnaA